MPLRNGFNFTPMFQGERVRMRAYGLDRKGTLMVAGDRSVRRSEFTGVVEDLDTLIPWVVRTAVCQTAFAMPS